MKRAGLILLLLVWFLGFGVSQVNGLEKCMTEVLAVAEFGSLSTYYESRQTKNEWLGFREEIVLPIVVHVLWHNEDENLSRLQVLSQIEEMNADFSARNDVIDGLPKEFAHLSVDSGIRFCLADSLGGIERQYTDYDTVGLAVDSLGHRVLSHTPYGGLDAWDSQRYINVWIGRMPKGTLGYYFTEFGGVQGIVIDPDVFGTVGTVANRPSNARGKTLTHELGHFLGLNHIWGFGCDLDDGISDTPPQEEPSYGCPSWPEWSCDSYDMYMNFMDYSNDYCLTMFTQGQVSRMHEVLATYYPDLGIDACQYRVGGKYTFQIFPNPVSDCLVVRIDGDEQLGEIWIFSPCGKNIYSKKILTPSTLNVSVKYWVSGVYWAVVRVGSGYVTQQFVVL